MWLLIQYNICTHCFSTILHDAIFQYNVCTLHLLIKMDKVASFQYNVYLCYTIHWVNTGFQKGYPRRTNKFIR